MGLEHVKRIELESIRCVGCNLVHLDLGLLQGVGYGTVHDKILLILQECTIPILSVACICVPREKLWPPVSNTLLVTTAGKSMSAKFRFSTGPVIRISDTFCEESQNSWSLS